MKRAVPRIALTREESAHALGMGLTSFEQYVAPHVRVIRRGKLRLVPVAELERGQTRTPSSYSAAVPVKTTPRRRWSVAGARITDWRSCDAVPD